jgi:DMSO/TMAO reductase YedYZ molybdopterin-dependent catalytic subunit
MTIVRDMDDRATVGDLEVIRRDPYNAESPLSALRSTTTATASSYVRTNFGVPALAGAHEILIHGAVKREHRVTIAQLESMPQQSISATMECAGNDRLGLQPLPVGEPWRHGALSTMTWSGVPLREVLRAAAPLDDVVEVLFTAADAGPRDDAEGDVRFARSLPIAQALRPETLVALRMNGAPLTADHGAPVRLAVPGWYGMASVKWLTHIELLRAPYAGYFQRERYVYDSALGVEPVTRMRVKSIITTPTDGDACERSIAVSGWAWSGDGAITHVAVGIDGGTHWQSATLGVPASAHAWTPFHITLEVPRAGRFVLRSRATDASGATQPDSIVWNRLGYGNNAVRHVVIDVA